VEDTSRRGGATEAEAAREEGEDRQVWVVGVEDFMRRFLPGRSNAKSIFALAQLNGIVKYACHKVRESGFGFRFRHRLRRGKEALSLQMIACNDIWSPPWHM